MKQKVEYLAHFGSDLMVVNVARVSFAKAATRMGKREVGLIRYLARLVEEDGRIKRQHVTPFFHPHVQVRFTVPIFVARQLMRSNIGISYNEMSRRYVDDEPEFWDIGQYRMRPDASIKQGSGDFAPPELQREVDDAVYQHHINSFELYNGLIERDIAPELARRVLPLDTMTQVIATMSLAAAWRVYQLRADPHAQKEIQELALELESIVEPLFPVSWNAFREAEAELQRLLFAGLKAEKEESA